MNNERRKKIKELCKKLNICLDVLENIKDEEQDSYDNLSDNLQYTRRGEIIQENVDALDEIYDKINEIIDDLNSL